MKYISISCAVGIGDFVIFFTQNQSRGNVEYRFDSSGRSSGNSPESALN
jgi:hypothetical protein